MIADVRVSHEETEAQGLVVEVLPLGDNWSHAMTSGSRNVAGRIVRQLTKVFR